jgi:hypothetical protein
VLQALGPEGFGFCKKSQKNISCLCTFKTKAYSIRSIVERWFVRKSFFIFAVTLYFDEKSDEVVRKPYPNSFADPKTLLQIKN